MLLQASDDHGEPAACTVSCGAEACYECGWKTGCGYEVHSRGGAGVASELDVCRQLYPGIDAYVSNPYLVTGNLTRHITSLKQHALELARDHALAQMEEAAALAAEGQEDLARRRRAKGARLLYKLAPGSCAKIWAIQTPDGSVVQEPGHMARVLRDHWSQVFTTRGVDVDLL